MRTLALIAGLFICTTTYAQLGFGPEISLGSSNMRFVPNSAFTSSSTSSIFSYKVGGVIDAPFSKHIYFQSGLAISHKGGNRNYSFYVGDSLNDYESRSLVLNYIDLPLTVVYKTRSQGKGRAILGMGATMSYLMGGSNTFNAHGSYNDTLFTKYAKTAPDQLLRKFDIGATFFIGYEMSTGLYFKLYYTSGVKDISLIPSEVSKNKMWGISAGFMFGKGRNINKDSEGLIDKSTD